MIGVNERLRPTERLHHAREFTSVFRRGRCFRTPHLRFHYRASRFAAPRLGLVVSRRLGNAVRRNRIKRRLREVFRRNKARLDRPYDVILVALGEPRPYADYEKAFSGFLAHLDESTGRAP